MIQRQPPLDEVTIADTVEAVFSAPEFNPTPSIWWWTDYIPRWRIDPTTARTVLLIIVATIVAVALARWLHRRRLERRYGLVPAAAGDARSTRDPWTSAQELAAAGDFAGAAHALHTALLEGMARREHVQLHPSKTIGDYLRELRARSSSILPTVREFARGYEPIAYGHRECRREDYVRLESLATAVIRPGAHAGGPAGRQLLADA